MALLAACGVPTSQQTRYTGPLAGCGLAGTATLTRIGDSFAFAPADGVLVLRGQVAPNGSLSATLNTQPAGKPAYVLTVRGRLDDESAVLLYTTPRCAAAATLTRVHPGLF
jgi:hypothetical protein